MAKAKVGAALDPLSMLGGLPSFTGGTAGPSMSDGTQTSTITIGSPFAVGSGSSANAENSGGASSASTGANNLVMWALLGLVAVAIVRTVRK